MRASIGNDPIGDRFWIGLLQEFLRLQLNEKWCIQLVFLTYQKASIKDTFSGVIFQNPARISVRHSHISSDHYPSEYCDHEASNQKSSTFSASELVSHADSIIQE